MVVEILNVGSEILIGDILNTNSKFLSFELSRIGLDVLWHTSVGDNKKRLFLAIENALKRSDVLVVTGGLGPTKDDITKEVVAKFVEKDLVEDFVIRKKIEEKFRLMGKEMTKNNYRQSFVIKGAVVFENEVGTAPAMAIEHGSKIIVLLPGPPCEVKEIFKNSVLPYFENLSNFKIFSKNVHIYGLTESKVDEIVSDFLINSNPTVGIYAKEGEVRLRVTAKAKTKEVCENMVDCVIKDIKTRLKNYVYGVDVENMQTALVEAFAMKNKTLSVAESCTGGLINSSIVEVAGSSKVLKFGAVCYSNESKIKILNVKRISLEKFGAVSFSVAKEMAIGVRKKFDVDVGISTTGVAGPEGGTKEKPVGLVYVGISTRKETKVFKLFLSRGEKNERNKIRKLAALFAMNKAREEILK